MIGDAAAEAAITAIKEAKVAPEKRPILTHCQVIPGVSLSGKLATGVSTFLCKMVVFSILNHLQPVSTDHNFSQYTASMMNVYSGSFFTPLTFRFYP